ncbi:unnamed protein product [Ranitomeya imitator]|uniref:SH3 domain-containing protein n=1 Tax=Ranitomeya imitator TaxID=111125 RepID=A0ABN9LKJ7_9NEOB|nr:unnamed protein product [Ranitomeya imitator]
MFNIGDACVFLVAFFDTCVVSDASVGRKKMQQVAFFVRPIFVKKRRTRRKTQRFFARVLHAFFVRRALRCRRTGAQRKCERSLSLHSKWRSFPSEHCHALKRPDGSYTEDQSQETEVKVTPTEFDDDFDDEEPLPTIGTCKALYPFDGENEGTISVSEGEVLSVIEEDKGDGWTRIRRNEEEEGYVPTSYIEVYLDKNAKGAKTYI